VRRGPLLLATRNPGKCRELLPMFADAGIEVIDLVRAGITEGEEERHLECYDTFEQNALAKARYFHVRTGLPTAADDSGLEVLALGGAPGVHSKRWSAREDLEGVLLDAANNVALCRAVAAWEDRRARYVCVAAFRGDEGEFAMRGITKGLIVDDARGTHGFGYDPHFLSAELGVTFGEASREQKERISHRGRAFRALLTRLGDCR
jgi:XTP/dITP diphosphohydrolase